MIARAGFCSIFAFVAVSASAATPSKAPFRVVLDPGHGGVDHGTEFDNGKIRIAEKDITLAISRLVAQKLKVRGVSVTLTRTQDQSLTLPARTALANRVRADLFISIHMNSSSTPMVSDAGGIETYILNHATDASSRRLAYFENNGLSARDPEAQDGENADVALILKDLRLDANLTGSKSLACALQGNLVAASTRLQLASSGRQLNRGVRQALFYVLLGADMPSALVEAGFLNNARDRALVLSSQGREALSNAVVRAIEQFRRAKMSPEGLSLLGRCKVN